MSRSAFACYLLLIVLATLAVTAAYEGQLHL